MGECKEERKEATYLVNKVRLSDVREANSVHALAKFRNLFEGIF